jgi:hypothetical protein
MLAVITFAFNNQVRLLSKARGDTTVGREWEDLSAIISTIQGTSFQGLNEENFILSLLTAHDPCMNIQLYCRSRSMLQYTTLSPIWEPQFHTYFIIIIIIIIPIVTVIIIISFAFPHSSFLKLGIKCYEFGVRALLMYSKNKMEKKSGLPKQAITSSLILTATL